MQDEVTGISRSGRVRKKSSKLMDFESPDDIETRFRRQTPVKSYATFRQEEPQEFREAPQPMEEGTASGSESDYYENNGEHAESMESDSSASDEGSARTPANSLYMMEKSKKKLIVKDGKVIGRAKAQRKDKGKTRITAYMMWAKEARNELLRNHPDMDFSAISKRLGEMWANVNYNERYLWKRKAKRFAMQKEQSLHSGVSKIISNPSIRGSNGDCGVWSRCWRVPRHRCWCRGGGRAPPAVGREPGHHRRETAGARGPDSSLRLGVSAAGHAAVRAGAAAGRVPRRAAAGAAARAAAAHAAQHRLHHAGPVGGLHRACCCRQLVIVCPHRVGPVDSLFTPCPACKYPDTVPGLSTPCPACRQPVYTVPVL